MPRAGREGPMRIVLTLLLLGAASAWAGYRVRGRDAVAAAILFLFSGLMALGIVATFMGWL